MRSVGDIALDAEVRAIASDAITDGEPVIVNSTGTVSGVTDALTEAIGTAVVYNGQATDYNRAVFDSHNNRIVVAYADQASHPYKGTAIVGTVSGTSISYGTEVVFDTGTASFIGMTFDSNSNRVVIAYTDGNNSEYGTVIVGTVDPSDNSISFGTPVLFNSTEKAYSMSCVFDSSNNKVVITYRDSGNSSYGTAIVGTVDSSDNSISFGTKAVFHSVSAALHDSAFDSSNNKVVITYQGYAPPSIVSRAYAVVATVDSSDNSISFGTPVDIVGAGAINNGTPVAFDSNSNKIVVIYGDSTDSTKGKAKVGTVSGTGISFGSAVTFESATDILYKAIEFDSSVNKVVIAYDYTGTDLKYVVGTVSSTSISFGTAVVFSTGNGVAEWSIDVTFDSSNNKSVIVFRDQSNSNHGTSHVFQNAQPTTLTSENFIGFAHAAYADGQKATVKTTGSIARNIPQVASASDALGTAQAFEEASVAYPRIAYDSNSDRIVVAYQDAGNSSYGTAIVGTVSGTSVTYGTPVVFESASIGAEESIDIVFDSSNNKVIVFYSASGGKAKVGTVDNSDNSISFGSAGTFHSGGTSAIDCSFDSSNNKVVVAFQDGDASPALGKAVVGTVSGTDISFGSEATFENATVYDVATTFDSNSNRVVIAYKDSGNSSHGTAIVGTVSGTDISFGTAVVFSAASTFDNSCTFDSSNNKVVITYSTGSTAKAIVGTVSNTAISFGTAVTFNNANTNHSRGAFHSGLNKIVIAYEDDGNSDYGTYIVGTVSGTDISFGSEVVFETAAIQTPHLAYDSTAQRMVIVYEDDANSDYGTSIVLNLAGTPEDLTIGQQYFVQTDGTLGTSADSPSVIAGTAIGASELIVKG